LGDILHEGHFIVETGIQQGGTFHIKGLRFL